MVYSFVSFGYFQCHILVILEKVRRKSKNKQLRRRRYITDKFRQFTMEKLCYDNLNLISFTRHTVAQVFSDKLKKTSL